MDNSELAALMLEWEETKDLMDEIEARIRDAVLELGKTQTVGNVRASYSGGRKTYDYETAGLAAPAEIITVHTATKYITDWKAVCEDAQIEAPVLRQSDPSVTIKLI